MQLLADPGFELGSPNWSFSNAQRVEAALSYSVYAKSGAYVGEVWSTRELVGIGPPIVWGDPVNGYITHQNPALPSGVYFVWAWVRQIAPGASVRLRVRAWDDATIPATEIMTTVAEKSSDDSIVTAPGWTMLCGFYDHDSSGTLSDSFYLVIDTVYTGPVPAVVGIWSIDDCGIEDTGMANREPFKAYKAVFDRLQTINGLAGGYYNDLTTSVVPFLRFPMQSGAPKVPYLCCCVEHNGPIETGDRGQAVMDLRIPVYGFFPTSESAEVTTSQAAYSLQMLADLLRCLLPDTTVNPVRWDLDSSVVEDVSLPLARAQAEPIEDVPPHVLVVAQARVRFTREELGPAAEGD